MGTKINPLMYQKSRPIITDVPLKCRLKQSSLRNIKTYLAERNLNLLPKGDSDLVTYAFRVRRPLQRGVFFWVQDEIRFRRERIQTIENFRPRIRFNRRIFR